MNRQRLVRSLPLLIALAACFGFAAASAGSEEPLEAPNLADLVAEALEVRIPTLSAAEHEEAAVSYRSILERLATIDEEELSRDERIDRDLLKSHVRTRLFEIEDLELWKLVPARYLGLWTTDSLFLRPCGQPDRVVREAAEELEKLPEILEHARENLTRPARPWTEYALEHARYAQIMLDEMVPEVCVRDEAAREELIAAAAVARPALEDFQTWMRETLLPRSTRSAAWAPEEIDFYQTIHEKLPQWDVDAMLALAKAEERSLTEEMEELAKRIHPSGDLHTVWELMKEEAPPWEEVPPMAARYVEMAAEWLRGPGSHLVDIPENLDYGVQITSPMARRLLSFGGASYGSTIAGRLSGYYVLTPIEPWISEEARHSRLKSYNPYWTHVISYHEWLGHNVQRAVALNHPQTRMREAYRSAYLSQAWSFYLEKLLEDEGYYEVLPHMETLKTMMARRQMRMWRVQRILTKLRMAKGETTFDEAVRAYVETIGMEPGNALIEVQRDSQNPSPPAREILGEKLILELRDEYARRTGEHFRPKDFHEALLSYGELPMPVVEKLVLGE